MLSIGLPQERCPAAVGNVIPSIISAIAWKPRCKWLRAVGGVVLHVSLRLCWSLAAKSVSVVCHVTYLWARCGAVCLGTEGHFFPRVYYCLSRKKLRTQKLTGSGRRNCNGGRKKKQTNKKTAIHPRLQIVKPDTNKINIHILYVSIKYYTAFKKKKN